MALDRTKLYLVLNENTHSVYFPTRTGGIMLDSAHDGVPTPYQAYFDDILSANSSSDVFRDGTLFFEECEQEAIYEELRISDWRNIWHNSDIEAILANPAMEDLQRIISPKSRNLYNRVRGVYVGMRNAGMEISQKARTVMDARQREIEQGILVSRIGIAPKQEIANEVEELKKVVESLKNQVAAVATPATAEPAPPASKPAPKPKAATKPKPTQPKAGAPKAK